MRRLAGRMGPFAWRLWRLWADLRLAVVLFAAVAVLCLLGVWLPQRPAALGADEAALSRWQSGVASRYGGLGALYAALGFFDVSAAPWLRLLVAALALNTAVCTANRLPSLTRSLVSPEVAQPAGFFAGQPDRAHLTAASRRGASEALARVLRRERYRLLWQAGDSGSLALYADQNRLGAWGTQVTHWALTLLVVSLVWLGPEAWREQLTLAPGQQASLAHRPATAVAVEMVSVDRRPDGLPRQVRAAVRALPDGLTREIWLNEPLVQQDIGYHVSSYGPAVRLAATDAGGRRLLLEAGGSLGPEAVLLFERDGLVREVRILDTGLSLHVSCSSGEGDGPVMLSIRPLRDGRPVLAVNRQLVSEEVVPLGDVTLRLAPTNYVVLLAVHDPSFVPAVCAALALMAGVILTLYMPHRRLWAHVDATGRIMLAGRCAGDPLSFQQHVSRMAAMVGEELTHGAG